jgi:chaperone required for assembly of F1-ATPase
MTDESPDDRMRRLITAPLKRKLPRRFYKSVEVSDQNGILLDGKPVKTPMKQTLVLPTRALALAVADEWSTQGTEIDLEAMTLTKLANTALDRATAERVHVLDEIVQYAGSDLVCYWADRPPDLVALQQRHWQPVLAWAASALGAPFRTVSGIQHVAQDEAALQAVRDHISALGAWQLTSVYLLMTLTGSSLLALMLLASATTPEAVWTAAHVDEDYQISQWGEDAEAAARRKARKLEFAGLVRFIDLLRSGD